MLSDNQASFAKAISADFGYRSESETQFAELFRVLLVSAMPKTWQKWMKAQRAPISALYRPAHNEIQPQPLGVVGIMVPWNYPLFLAIGPMIDALTAGNRIMIKMSEAAPQFAQTFADTIARYFSSDMICVVLGEVDIAAAFSELPFDHLLYTGSTAVGKKVMAAAAPNLTPVTLELGGKSPVIVFEDANLGGGRQSCDDGQNCKCWPNMYCTRLCVGPASVSRNVYQLSKRMDGEALSQHRT